jgi:hypothetical protein
MRPAHWLLIAFAVLVFTKRRYRAGGSIGEVQGVTLIPQPFTSSLWGWP